MDAFAQDWNGEIAWCCPPVNLVIAALKKIAASKMQAILVIPAWRSAAFWAFVFPDGCHAIDICISISDSVPLLSVDVIAQTFCFRVVQPSLSWDCISVPSVGVT